MATVNAGSSPLARGTLERHLVAPRGRRFIPARAGNTGGRGGRGLRRPVHPRSRGEHMGLLTLPVASSGSSPLARGTRIHHVLHFQSPRFIPARAGNTLPDAWTVSPPAVHPRSRGEHSFAAIRSPGRHGSSPLARGTPGGPFRRRRPDRFIPARAGNTRWWSRTSRAIPVHPRSRGEHHATAPATASAIGSSPLARGTLLAAPDELDGAPVHPRSRGEHGASSIGGR